MLPYAEINIYLIYLNISINNYPLMIFRQCSAIKHIPDVAKGFKDTQAFKELPQRVSEIRKRLAHERQSRTENDAAVHKSGDKCRSQIQTLRHTFNVIFDRLERHTISEMERSKSSLRNNIQTDVDQIDDVTEKLKMLTDALKDGSDTNEALSYIGFSKCDYVIFNVQLLLQTIANKDDFKMTFQPFKGITEYLSSLEVLGEVICEGGEKPLPGPDHVFEVEKHVLHNVKVADDKNPCYITGTCRLANGEFLLSDSKNSKLKLLNNSYQVISTSDVQDEPQDVCSTGQREAAVTMDDGKNRHEILLVRVKAGKIEQMNTIKLQRRCRGLAHHGGHLYVTTLTALHVYDMAGGQGRQLYIDKKGVNTVHRCAVSPDGCRIYITNYLDHQLITLNKDGTTLSTLTHPELQYPVTPHVTAQGHVFVTCNRRNTVVQVTEKNSQQIVTTLAGKNNGLTSPRPLCFNSNDSLLVGQWNDNIVELKLK